MRKISPKHIVALERTKPIETTGELNEIIKAAIPAKMRQTVDILRKRRFRSQNRM